MGFDISMSYANQRKGDKVGPLLSDERAQLVQPYGGKWYHAAKQGRLFMGSEAAAGVVLPIYSATAAKFVLWNPANSGVNLVLVRFTATYIDTTCAATGFTIGIGKNAGSSLATGGVSAFTETVPERAPFGSSTGGNQVRFSLAATIIAPTVLYQMGENQLVLTATDATTAHFVFRHDFDGEMVIAPNNLISIGGNIAQLGKWSSSMMWVEEPV
jgi:hypothetical protein